MKGLIATVRKTPTGRFEITVSPLWAVVTRAEGDVADMDYVRSISDDEVRRAVKDILDKLLDGLEIKKI